MLRILMNRRCVLLLALVISYYTEVNRGRDKHYQGTESSIDKLGAIGKMP